MLNTKTYVLESQTNRSDIDWGKLEMLLKKAIEKEPESIPRFRTFFSIFTGLWAYGVTVVPICKADGQGKCRFHRDCPSPGKVPLVRWKTWTPTVEAVMRFIESDVNWAVRCDANLHVLDFDKAESFSSFVKRMCAQGVCLRDAAMVRTGRLYHIYFKPKTPVASFSSDGVEIKGLNSLAIAPPSVHMSGKRYKWVRRLDGSLPELDIRALFGRQSPLPAARELKDYPALSGAQQQKIEQLLSEYLPGFRKVSSTEWGGYLDFDSKSRAHIKVNPEKGVYMDWRKNEGGTIRDLLRRLGVALPPELGGMGEGDIPEYFPVWAWNRHWWEVGQCGQFVTLFRKNGVPFWVGRAVCLQWSCPECAIRLKNIVKQRLKRVGGLTVLKAPRDSTRVIAKVRRNIKFEYARVKNRADKYLLLKSDGDAIQPLIDAGFSRTELTPQDAIDGLPYAAVGRRQRRFIPSRAFDVGIDKYTPGDKKHASKKGAGAGPERSASAEKDTAQTGNTHSGESNINNSNMDMVILDETYPAVLEKLGEMGFIARDVGAGDSHKLFGNTPVAPDELGAVVDVVTLGTGPPRRHEL